MKVPIANQYKIYCVLKYGCVQMTGTSPFTEGQVKLSFPPDSLWQWHDFIF